jgi:hypothetical protein
MARLLVVCLLGSVVAFTQTNNGRIEGTVQDSSGSAVPGARLTATNVQTQLKVETTSGSQGEFVLTPLPPGIYKLTTEASGFRRSDIQAIEVNVGAVVAQIVRLEVGSLTETVTVEANAVTVATTDTQLYRSINIRDIDTLPQLGRTPITLSAFQVGVQTNPGDVSFSRVNGMRVGANNSKLDGVDINDSVVPRLGLSMTANNTDSIGEFRMVLGGGKAEYGRNAGGQVELITRSGTNDFHGNAYDALRNTDLNANDFFNNQSGGTRPKFIQNYIGGSFGGRIFRDRTFIFGNYQARRTRQETVRNRIVYTPSAKQGIFRWNAAGSVQSFNFAAADPRGIGIDKGVAKLNAQMPDPNNNDTGDGLNTAGFRFNTPSNSYEDQFTIKGDHNITNLNHAFLRWSWQRNSSIDTLNNAERTFPGQIDGTQGGHRWGFAVGDDWTFKPNLMNELRVGYQSAVTAFLRPNRPNGPAYITNLVNDVQYARFEQGRNSPVIDITENLTWLHGTHTFKMGTSLRRVKQYGYDFDGTQPNLSPGIGNGNAVPASFGPQGLTSAQRSTFDQLYNDIMGRLDRVILTFYSDLDQFQPAGAPRVRNYLLREGGFFFQDDWKVSRKLTINAGLRYEVFLKPIEESTLQGRIDKAELVDGIHRMDDLTVQRSNDWFGTDWNNFAPRLGFAYDPKGNGKTAIRGNFGIYYDRAMGSVVSGIDSNTIGFTQQVPEYPNQGGTDVRYSDSYKLPATPANPVLKLAPTRSSTIRLTNPNLRTGYVANWSLNLQREIFRNTVVDAGYVANRGIKLYMHRDLNQPQVTPEILADFKQLAAFAGNNATAVPASNVFVRIFGTPAAAASALSATNLTQGRLGTALNTLDTNSANFNRYAAAGLPNTFLRAYPQFNQVQVGVNDGRSYYDSLQLSIRHNGRSLKSSFNYTFSHSLDNVGGYSTTSSTQEGNGYAPPIDNFNLRLMRGTADFDRRHVFNSTVAYSLPVGRGKKFLDRGGLADTLIGGWDIGALITWQTGAPFTIFSTRATTAETTAAWINYSGPTHIGSLHRRGDGVFLFTPEEMAAFTAASVFPAAGEIGSSGRNLFRNPRFFNLDMSLVKKFRIHEGHAITFRAEAYNVFNHPNFQLSATNTATSNVNPNNPTTFGKFSTTVAGQGTSARTMQLTLRYDF